MIKTSHERLENNLKELKVAYNKQCKELRNLKILLKGIREYFSEMEYVKKKLNPSIAREETKLLDKINSAIE